MDNYRIDHVLIPASSPLAFLLEHSPGWRMEKREGAGDRSYKLFAKIAGAAEEQAPCTTVTDLGNR